MSDLGQSETSELSPGKRACIRRWQQIEAAAREVRAAYENPEHEYAWDDAMALLIEALDG